MSDITPASNIFATIKDFVDNIDFDCPERQARVRQMEADEAAEKDRKRLARLAESIATIPDAYQQPFIPARSKLPAHVIKRVMEWSPRSSLGMGLVGDSGISKTWLMCALLLTLDCRFMFLRSSALATAARDKASAREPLARHTAESLLAEAFTVPVLLLDDIGDEAVSEIVTETLKSLVEHRTSSRLRTLWTSQLARGEIGARHGKRGISIERRLVDYSPVIM